MAPMLLAEAAQAGRLLAQAMLLVRTTEATQVNVLKQRFRVAPLIVIEQRRGCDGRGRRQDDPCIRRSRVEGEHSHDDAAARDAPVAKQAYFA